MQLTRNTQSPVTGGTHTSTRHRIHKVQAKVTHISAGHIRREVQQQPVLTYLLDTEDKSPVTTSTHIGSGHIGRKIE